MDVPTLHSSRLDLVSVAPAFVDALVDGRRDDAHGLIGATVPDDWPDPHDERFYVLRRDQMKKEPERQAWIARAIVLRERGEMIGHAGFHGPPGTNSRGDPAAVEVGYAIFPPHRGNGYATEAVGALIRWARDQGLRRFLASVAPDNEPSLAIVRKLGFVHVGEHWDDEDGRELEFQLETG